MLRRLVSRPVIARAVARSTSSNTAVARPRVFARKQLFAGATVAALFLGSLFGKKEEAKASGEGEPYQRTKLIADLSKPEPGTATIEDHPIVFAPNVPPPIRRRNNATVRIHMTSEVKDIQVCGRYKYRAWTFNGDVPGPFIRVRVGDVLEVHHTNLDMDMAHNIDFHAVKGPGGGAQVTYAESGQTRIARFKMQRAGLFIYHCAAAPVPVHIANGMYGLVLVEPEWGLPAVEREYYVMQSEWYPLIDNDTPGLVTECNYEAGLNERPELIVFNGRENALVTKPLKANISERVS